MEAAAILAKWGRGRLADAEQTYDLYVKDGYFLPQGTMTGEELSRYVNLLREAKWIERAGDPARFADFSLAETANRALAPER
jgi:hypothetical protein